MGYEEERKQTHMLRFYGKEGTESEDFWIDIQIIDKITFNGMSWPSGDRGNQFQKTTVHVPYQDDDHPQRMRQALRVYNPQDKNQYIDIQITNTIGVRARSNYQYQGTGRWFDNSDDNESRVIVPLRIINNNIGDEFLTNVTGANGRTTKQPPSDPDKYLEVVQKTNEKDDGQYLDIELIDKFGIVRGKGFQYQVVIFNGIWNNTLLANSEGGGDILPGVEQSPGGVPAVMLDPLITIVNLGFAAGLAVDFGDKATDAPPPPKKDTTKK